jgi:hypothetical protein
VHRFNDSIAKWVNLSIREVLNLAEIFLRGEFPKWEWRGSIRGAPSPRSTGIMDIGGNPKLNLGAQSLRGKILVSKNLASAHRGTEFHYGTIRISTYRHGFEHDLDHDDDPMVAVNARSDVTRACGNKNRKRPVCVPRFPSLHYLVVPAQDADCREVRVLD